MAEKYKLTYFNARGRGEYIRLIFAVAGVEYEDFRIEIKDWAQYKPKTPQGMVPYLEINGEKIMTQSYAICRYLARKYGLHGKDDLEGMRIDMIVACQEDYYRPVVGIQREPDPEVKQRMRENFVASIPEQLERFQKILEENNNGDSYMVGDELTWADLAFYHGTNWPDVFGMQTPWEQFPKLKSYRERVEGHPKVKAWIETRPASPW